MSFLSARILRCAVLAVLPVLAPQAQRPVTTVSSVEIARYSGEWFEVARYPNRFQDQCAGDVRATYKPLPDGRLEVTNQCRTMKGETDVARGVARIVDRKTNAKLKVRFAPAMLSFLPFVWGDYWIIGLAEDYSWAVVGSPDRDYLWILSRTPVLPDPAWEIARARAAENGFDLRRLVRTENRSGVLPRPRLPHALPDPQ